MESTVKHREDFARSQHEYIKCPSPDGVDCQAQQCECIYGSNHACPSPDGVDCQAPKSTALNKNSMTCPSPDGVDCQAH